MELYREIEQKRGLKVRVLPFGSTTRLTDIVKANEDARAHQSLASKSVTSGHKKRSSDKITDDEKEGKKSKKKKTEKTS